jgi:hypothetical protein
MQESDWLGAGRGLPPLWLGLPASFPDGGIDLGVHASNVSLAAMF